MTSRPLIPERRHSLRYGEASRERLRVLLVGRFALTLHNLKLVKNGHICGKNLKIRFQPSAFRNSALPLGLLSICNTVGAQSRLGTRKGRVPCRRKIWPRRNPGPRFTGRRLVAARRRGARLRSVQEEQPRRIQVVQKSQTSCTDPHRVVQTLLT